MNMSWIKVTSFIIKLKINARSTIIISSYPTFVIIENKQAELHFLDAMIL